RDGMLRMMPLFAALDTDRDGTISSAEIENAAAALRKLDKNNDGKLEPHELRPHFAGRPGPPPRDGDRAHRDRDRARDGGEEARRDGNRSLREGNRSMRDRDRAPRDGDRG